MLKRYYREPTMQYKASNENTMAHFMTIAFVSRGLDLIATASVFNQPSVTR